jgi:L-lactate permease
MVSSVDERESDLVPTTPEHLRVSHFPDANWLGPRLPEIRGALLAMAGVVMYTLLNDGNVPSSS